MSELTKQERVAIEAAAKRFSTKWEKGTDPPHAFITVGRKRVAVDITTLKQRGTAQGGTAKPHLRFDRVATRLMERLQTTLGETVPGGMTVLLTITAPIRLASKTAAALEQKIQTLLGRRLAGRDEKDMIHGNRVRIRLLRDETKGRPRMIGFVHNPDTDPLLLMSMTLELLEAMNAETSKRATRIGVRPGLGNDRWLVLISAHGISCLEAYRYIYSHLPVTTDFKKILMVFGDGGVSALTG